MLNKIIIISDISRIYSLPTTVMSWFVVFVFGLLDSGSCLYGIVALIGISFVHLATNILDDFFDYKFMIKQVGFNKKEYLENTQKTKCRSIVSGIISEGEVLALAFIYLMIAGVIGLFFFVKCGMPVLYFGLIGGLIAVCYSFFSKLRLSELCVAVAYGPALFGGVYFVMTQTVSWEIFLLSLPTMFMTVVLLYIHTIMDFDYDIKEGHLTLANSFDSQLDALVVLKILLILAYISLILLCIFDITNWQVFFVYLTIPLGIDLYKSLEDFSLAPESIPKKKWFHFPMENMKRIQQMGAESFMIRMYQSRNLMIYFSLIFAVSIIISTL